MSSGIDELLVYFLDIFALPLLHFDTHRFSNSFNYNFFRSWFSKSSSSRVHFSYPQYIHMFQLLRFTVTMFFLCCYTYIIFVFDILLSHIIIYNALIAFPFWVIRFLIASVVVSPSEIYVLRYLCFSVFISNFITLKFFVFRLDTYIASCLSIFTSKSHLLYSWINIQV